jgi:hypothetical protein
MKVPYNLTWILSALVVALSVIGLVASPISASVTTAGSDLTSGSSLTNPGHHFVVNTTQQTTRFQTMIITLGQQGVDITEPQAALSAGNLTAVSQWFKTYRSEHPGTGTNVSWQMYGNSTRWQQGTALAKYHPGWNRTLRKNSMMTNSAGQAG